jgi:hypothetical protein
MHWQIEIRIGSRWYFGEGPFQSREDAEQHARANAAGTWRVVQSGSRS